MVINKLRGVMRIPYFPIALILSVAATVYLAITDGPKQAAGIWDICMIGMFAGCIGAAFWRAVRID